MSSYIFPDQIWLSFEARSGASLLRSMCTEERSHQDQHPRGTSATWRELRYNRNMRGLPKSQPLLMVLLVCLAALQPALAAGRWHCLDGRVCPTCPAPAANSGVSSSAEDDDCACPPPAARQTKGCNTCCRLEITSAPDMIRSASPVVYTASDVAIALPASTSLLFDWETVFLNPESRGPPPPKSSVLVESLRAPPAA
jgi:hypothetical protein